MSIMMTAMALAAAPATTAAQPASARAPAAHAQHAQPVQQRAKPQSDGCSCCKMMTGGGKMECCAKHGEGHGSEHSEHSAHR